MKGHDGIWYFLVSPRYQKAKVVYYESMKRNLKNLYMGVGVLEDYKLMLLLSKVLLLFKPESKPQNEGIQNPNSNG
jgi:hypothetical protein